MRNYSKDLYQKNRMAWIAGFLVLMIALGALVGWAPKAFAMCTHNPDGTCAISAHRGLRLFKAGHYTHADGIPWKRVTTHPRRVKAVLHHKFAVYYMHASAAKKKAIRERYNLHFSSARDIDGGCSFGWGMAGCAASHLLGSLNRVSCASSDDFANPDDDSCVTITGILGLHHGKGLTKDQVQKSGQVGFCGSGAMLMVRTATTAPTPPGAVLAAGVGTGACLWSAWTLFDPAN